MNQYLEQNQSKRAPIQFKYSKHVMQSVYSSEYLNPSLSRDGSNSPTPQKRTKPFNKGCERQALLMPFNPPRNFSTIYTENFLNRKGSDEVGALTKNGYVSQPRRKAPKPEIEHHTPEGAKYKNKLQDETTNQMTFIAHQRLPTPNIKERPKITTGYGTFYGQTSYGSNFTDGHTENYRE